MNSKKITLLITCFNVVFFLNCSKNNENMSIFEYLEQPEEKWNIGVAALLLSKDMYPDIEFSKYTNIIDGIASRVEVYVQNRTDPEYRIAAINTVLFREYGFGYDKNDFLGRNPYNHFISSVLDRRKGVCTSLPLLYMIIAEKLGYPICAVEAPDHTFCRYVLENGNYLNIEVTSGGGEVPDLFYIDDMNIPKQPFKNGVYMRTLSKKEYVGSLLHKNAVSYMIKGDFKTAVNYLEKSVSLHPKNSHNHKVLAHCYGKICNSLESAKERKPYYLKAIEHEKIAEGLGIAPPCPEDYWKIIVKKDTEIVTSTSGNITKINDESLEEKLKVLEVKYHDYFE
ncbi:MAG TPA: transglutaminase family protein [Spirochaetota bacterium]|nr:transglutaminase family protein [Spirochaetota bacterium]